MKKTGLLIVIASVAVFAAVADAAPRTVLFEHFTQDN